MVDCLARPADCLGERVLLVVGAPAAAVVHLDKMGQRAVGAEQSLFGIVALGVMALQCAAKT